MGNFRHIQHLLKADLFRDKCEHCSLWTVFELSLTDGAVCARCTYCGEFTHFAGNVADARRRAASVNKGVSLLEVDYPELRRLDNLGEGVALPWYVKPDHDTPGKAA